MATTELREDEPLETFGDQAFTYRIVSNWAKIPKGWNFRTVAAVAVDRQDNVYAFHRGGDHPLIVFDRDGNVIRTWGDGTFVRPHGLHIGPDDSIYCTDDRNQVVRKYTLDGKLLLEIGIPGQAQPAYSGLPFNRCTHTALSPENDIYLSDGYQNARVHKYSQTGKLLLSWGEPGSEPGQFNVPHNICADDAGWVYVADRENHRIQVFDGSGRYEGEWRSLHRPCCISMEGGPNALCYVGEVAPEFEFNKDAPNLGPRLSILSKDGKVVARIGSRKPLPGDALLHSARNRNRFPRRYLRRGLGGASLARVLSRPGDAAYVSDTQEVRTRRTQGEMSTMGRITRRTFASAAGALGTGSLLTSRASAQAYGMRMSVVGPTTGSLVQAGFAFSRAVSSRTNGQLMVDIYPNGQLINMEGSVAALASGVVDLAIISTGSLVGTFPRWQVFDVPFMYKDEATAYRVFLSAAGDQLSGDLEAKGLVGLTWGSPGFKQICTTTKVVATPEDMKGLRIRTTPSPVFVQTYQALGAVPVVLDTAEAFTALAQHTVDGVDNVVWILSEAKWYTVLKHVAMASLFLSVVTLVGSKRQLDAMPANLQKKIVKKKDTNLVPVMRSLSDKETSRSDRAAEGERRQFQRRQPSAFPQGRATRLCDDSGKSRRSVRPGRQNDRLIGRSTMRLARYARREILKASFAGLVAPGLAGLGHGAAEADDSYNLRLSMSEAFGSTFFLNARDFARKRSTNGRKDA